MPSTLLQVLRCICLLSAMLGCGIVHAQVIGAPVEQNEVLIENDDQPATSPTDDSTDEDQTELTDEDGAPAIGPEGELETTQDAPAEDDGEDDLESNDAATHQIAFDNEIHVVFNDLKTQIPYLEVIYRISTEAEVPIIETRRQTEAELAVEVDISGLLAGNEFFSCELGIDISPIPIRIKTRLVEPGNPRGRPSAPLPDQGNQLSLQFLYTSADMLEDWHSNCNSLDGSGAELNTSGAPEHYLFMALEGSDPVLSEILADEFDPSSSLTLPVKTELIEIEDDFDLITLWGNGTIILTPM